MNTKREYHLYCYNSGNYKNLEDALSCGGNHEIESFMLDSLDASTLNDSSHSHAILDCISVANNAINVFGYLDDAVYYITSEKETDVLFMLDHAGVWNAVEKPDQTQTAVIPVNISVSVSGVDLVKHEAKIREIIASAIQRVMNESDENVFENLVLDAGLDDNNICVANADVKCTEPITYNIKV